MKPNDLKFLLKIKSSDTKGEPFRRIEITSQFLVSDVPVYMVCFSGLFWVVSEVFLVGFDQRVEFHSLCYIRDHVLNDCTCEFQKIRQQLPFLLQTARQQTSQQFLSVL